MTRFLRAWVPCVLACMSVSVAHAASRTVAIVGFQFRDTSGEANNQRIVHAARIQVFMASLAKDLTASRKYRVVALDCASCEIVEGNVEQFAEPARRAGASYLLVGGIQKMSTLVQWAEVALIDLETSQAVLKKLYTFRGDSDEAWRHAEQFIAGQIISFAP